MKVIWEPCDIYPGRKIAEGAEGSDRSWFIAKHHIGGYSLVDSEGTIWDSQTRSEMSKYLTDYGYRPQELV